MGNKAPRTAPRTECPKGHRLIRDGILPDCELTCDSCDKNLYDAVQCLRRENVDWEDGDVGYKCSGRPSQNFFKPMCDFDLCVVCALRMQPAAAAVEAAVEAGAAGGGGGGAAVEAALPGGGEAEEASRQATPRACGAFRAVHFAPPRHHFFLLRSSPLSTMAPSKGAASASRIV